jgi:hypothetical protein
MNRNLVAVALTVGVLGAVAALDIIPGAGLYAGLVMLALAGLALIPSLAEWSTSLRSRRTLGTPLAEQEPSS